MAKGLTEEIVDYMKLLYSTGDFDYHHIALEIFRRDGLFISDDVVRYHVTRKDKPKLTTVEKLASDGISRKLILSDLHIPYHLEEVFSIVEKHKDEIDEIIFNGDTTDCEEISKFVDLGRVSLEREMAETHNVLTEIDNMTPNIPKTMVLGNHEFRWRKYLANTGTVLNSLHSGNILHEICGGFSIHDHHLGIETKYKPLPNYTTLNDWWMVLADGIVCHPISFSKIYGRTATNAYEYFRKQGYDPSFVVVGHTHSQAMTKPNGKYAFETGCLCKPMAYATSGKLSFEPQDLVYFIVTLKDGVYQPNESGIQYL